MVTVLLEYMINVLLENIGLYGIQMSMQCCNGQKIHSTVNTHLVDSKSRQLYPHN